MMMTKHLAIEAPSTVGRKATAAVLIALSAACAQIPDNSREFIDQILISNDTGVFVSDVTLFVPAENVTLKIGNLAAGSDYELNFPTARNTRHAATLRWQQEGQALSATVLSHIPEVPDTTKPHTVAISIRPAGRLRTTVEPHHPD